MSYLKIYQSLFFLLIFIGTKSQYKSFDLTDRGDTINIVDKKGLKQGDWIITMPALREEEGYDEEGFFKNDKKEGVWRKYNLTGDLIAVENYKFGGKDGVQQYFTFTGNLVREESWKSFNPNNPYDTIPVYGAGNNEIISFKIVRVQQYSVKDGLWKFYDPETGRIFRSETYERNLLKPPKIKPEEEDVAKEEDKPKQKVKPKEVLEYEKKNRKKKKIKYIDGSTRM